MYKVYVITCTQDGSVYVGMTSRSLEERFNQDTATSHRGQYARGLSNPLMTACIDKYGFDSLIIEEIFSTNSKEECMEAEEYFTVLAKWTGKCMNIMNGHHHAQSTKDKISETASSNMTYLWTTEEYRSSRLSVPIKDSTRVKRSKSITEKWKDGEYKRKQSEKKCKKVYCTETDTIYSSAQDASDKLGIPYSSLKQACRSGYNKKYNLHLKYID